jgi:hypothetical protein
VSRDAATTARVTRLRRAENGGPDASATVRDMTGLVADGGTSHDQIITLLYVLAVLFGWVAFSRLRGRAFNRLPEAGAWASAVLAVSSVVLAVVLPPIISPEISSARPSSTARIVFLSPRPEEIFRTTSQVADVPVRLHLVGGRIVAFTSTKLVPNTGHVHLYLDGALVQMTTTLHRNVGMVAGPHTLRAEFVAVDHAPFDPPVVDSVSFVVRAAGS